MEQDYTIAFSTGEKRIFKSAKTAKSFLVSEKESWSKVSDYFEKIEDPNLRITPSNINPKVTVFGAHDRLITNLSDRAAFNATTQSWRRGVHPPPPSNSLEGRLILGLAANGHWLESFSALAAVLALNPGPNSQNDHNLNQSISTGNTILLSAKSAEALPFSKSSVQRVKSLHSTAEENLKSLEGLIVEAEKLISEHRRDYDTHAQAVHRVESRWAKVFRKRELRRQRIYEDRLDTIDAAASARFKSADIRLAAIKRLEANRNKAREAEFKRLQDLFYTQLKLKAPVKLWEERYTQHLKTSRRAFGMFLVGTGVVVAAGALVPLLFGDAIADSFSSIICTPVESNNCERVFSAKGPLTISCLVIAFSVSMWVVRLQYRVFLSERHLSLDAEEKKAFAETYMAMKEGEDVNPANEAIVLASLFRPTQDGIIKDDESGVDLSAAAILAKQLGRAP